MVEVKDLFFWNLLVKKTQNLCLSSELTGSEAQCNLKKIVKVNLD